MATLVQDPFTRADSTTVPGSPVVGSAPTVRVGTWGILSNQLYTSASTAESLITWPTAADVDMTATFSQAGDHGFVHGWIDASNYWLCQYNTNQIGVYRRVAGTFYLRSQLISVPVVSTATIRFVMLGRLFYVYWGSALWLSGEDDTPTANTRPSISGFRNHSNTTGRFDDLMIIDPAALSVPAGSVLDLSTTPYLAPSAITGHVYKGRDRKTLDTVGAA